MSACTAFLAIRRTRTEMSLHGCLVVPLFCLIGTRVGRPVFFSVTLSRSQRSTAYFRESDAVKFEEFQKEKQEETKKGREEYIHSFVCLLLFALFLSLGRMTECAGQSSLTKQHGLLEQLTVGWLLTL